MPEQLVSERLGVEGADEGLDVGATGQIRQPVRVGPGGRWPAHGSTEVASTLPSHTNGTATVNTPAPGTAVPAGRRGWAHRRCKARVLRTAATQPVLPTVSPTGATPAAAAPDALNTPPGDRPAPDRGTDSRPAPDGDTASRRRAAARPPTAAPPPAGDPTPLLKRRAEHQ